MLVQTRRRNSERSPRSPSQRSSGNRRRHSESNSSNKFKSDEVRSRRRSSDLLCALTDETESSRHRSDLSQRFAEVARRRRSVGGSFAEYNPDQVDLTHLAMQALKQYLPDDNSEDDHSVEESDYDEDETVSYGSSNFNDDGDSYFSGEDETLEDRCSEKAADDESLNLSNMIPSHEGEGMESTPCFQPHSSWAKPLASALTNFNDSPNKKKKTLCFGTVTIREYAVTIGALLASKDQYPLELGWEYACDVRRTLPPTTSTSPESPERIVSPLSTPRRLTWHERRRRIAVVQGIPENIVDDMQFDLLMSQIKELIQSDSDPALLHH